MSHPRQADLGALLRALVDARVEFIVVGGAAAVLHGAPTTTLDLDIVHARTPDNVDRLLTVLDDLHAYVREPADRRLPPPRSALAGDGQMNLSTTLGPLDPLCRLHDGRDFQALLPTTEKLAAESMELLVLDLPTLIEVKADAGRAKDRLVLPILIALLQERGGG